MEEADVSPDVHVLNACIGACAKAGEVAQAVRLLREEFVRLDLTPDVTSAPPELFRVVLFMWPSISMLWSFEGSL